MANLVPVFWAISLVSALAYLPLTSRDAGHGRSAIKTIPVVGFALIAALSGAPVLLGVGLALSALGDFALSRDGERAFLMGLIAFALAHVCYAALFAMHLGGLSFWSVVPLVALALSTELWLIPHTGALKAPVRVYVLLICAMSVTALNLPQDYALARVGVVAFLMSDLILSLQLFRMAEGTPRARGAGWALWALYIVAQVLILLAFLP